MAIMNYISQIIGNKIVAHCSDKKSADILLSMGARRKLLDRNRYEFVAGSKESVAVALENLRDAGFFFVGGVSGWPPAAVFMNLRDEGLVKGPINVVTWKSPNTPVIEKDC